MYYVHFLSSCFTITSKTDKVFFIKYFKGILEVKGEDNKSSK